MIVSNEPGYYEDGNFGIRIENLLIVKNDSEKDIYKGRSFMKFEKLTYFPIQLKMIDLTLLTNDEVIWINKYHQDIRDKVLPIMRTETSKKWLLKQTETISKNTFN
jgi:Xaa-Pro aminopeptidase